MFKRGTLIKYNYHSIRIPLPFKWKDDPKDDLQKLLTNNGLLTPITI